MHIFRIHIKYTVHTYCEVVRRMANRATTEYRTRRIPNKDNNKKTAGNKTNFSGVLNAMPSQEKSAPVFIYCIFSLLLLASPFASNRFCDRFAIFVAFIFLFIRIRRACGAYEQMKSFRSWKWRAIASKTTMMWLELELAGIQRRLHLHRYICMLCVGVTALRVCRQMLTHFGMYAIDSTWNTHFDVASVKIAIQHFWLGIRAICSYRCRMPAISSFCLSSMVCARRCSWFIYFIFCM